MHSKAGSIAKQPTTLPLLKDSHTQLQVMIREMSRKRFSDISGVRDLLVDNHERPDDLVYGSHLTVIQIAAKDLRLTFKAHFSISHVKILTQKWTGPEKTPREILKSTYDLFKEYSNLVAGGISQQLHSCGIIAGISLPIATSGFDELIASDEIRRSRLYDFWQIKTEGLHFNCSMNAEIFESDLLDIFCYRDTGSDEEAGEIEIL